MTMKINYKSYISFFAYLLNEIFNRANFRTIYILLCNIPFSI